MFFQGETYTLGRKLLPEEEQKKLIEISNWKLDMNEVIKNARKKDRGK